ncbi:ACT domain-containing protein [Zhaonella formicivorans]|jgi:ACT domain-containing protein|uniref:ACT domain-containing protein n=1 Tax=Zhaonella formicivorans TaxID=2528593 RepID=UPI001D11D647|nr:ACT domain-containing protein [Zhaonella formicivorans]
MGRIIVTVVGIDRVGIIAEITSTLAKNNINILDISQTIMQDFFTMILIADMAASSVDLPALKTELEKIAIKLGLQISAQNEEVFRFMHRI